MQTAMTLRRAAWSIKESQVLTGINERGEYTSTTTVFATEKVDVYRTFAGGEVLVLSWAPDPAKYRDVKK